MISVGYDTTLVWAFVFIVAAVAIALPFAGFTPAVLFVLIPLLAGAAAIAVHRRRSGAAQMREFRGQARKAVQDDPDVQFTDRDRTTLS